MSFYFLKDKDLREINPDEPFDSKPETLEHKARVEYYIQQITTELDLRGKLHDESKLYEPEKSILDKMSLNLSKVKYGSKEYEAQREKPEFQKYLNHHYKNNRHHIEYHKKGVEDMNLIDLIEMLADWQASTERTMNGDLKKSIKYNQEKHGYPDIIQQILLNTVEYLKWENQNIKDR